MHHHRPHAAALARDRQRRPGVGGQEELLRTVDDSAVFFGAELDRMADFLGLRGGRVAP